jgi:hypothetical protein
MASESEGFSHFAEFDINAIRCIAIEDENAGAESRKVKGDSSIFLLFLRGHLFH